MVYNGEWRELRYDPACERLYYGEDEKYFRKPYNFLKYHFEVICTGHSQVTVGGGGEGERPVAGDGLLALEDSVSCRACWWLKVPLYLPLHVLGAEGHCQARARPKRGRTGV